MRSYERTLAERRRKSERQSERYWSEPDFRIRQINAARASQGRSPRKSVDEIQHRGPVRG